MKAQNIATFGTEINKATRKVNIHPLSIH